MYNQARRSRRQGTHFVRFVAPVAAAAVAGLCLSACGSSSKSSSASSTAATGTPGTSAVASPSSAVSPSSSAGGPATSGQPFMVGIPLPLSGPLGGIGQVYVDGLKAEADLLNSAGGVQGHPIKVIALDDAGDPTRAIAAAKQLIEQDHVKFMVPDILDPDVTAIMPFTTAAKVLTITGQGATDVTSPKWPYEFQYDLPYSGYAAAAVAAFKARGITVTKVGVVDTTTGSPSSVFSAYAKLSQFGIKVVDTEAFDATSTNITPQLAKIQAAGAQAILTATGGTTLTTLFNGLNSLGLKIPVIGSTATTTSLDLNKLIPASQQSEFSATTFAIQARQGNAVPPRLNAWITALKKYGPITSILTPSGAADQLHLAVWAYNAVGFSATGAAAAKQLEKTSTTTFPANFFLTVGNPRWSASDHSDGPADSSKAWGLVKVGPLIDGTYPGSPLTLAQPSSS